jgi:hypothetical protein
MREKSLEKIFRRGWGHLGRDRDGRNSVKGWRNVEGEAFRKGEKKFSNTKTTN